MKGPSNDLLKDLDQRTREVLEWAEGLRSRSEEELNARESEDRWSVLECLEHLNRYGDFYLPEIERRMNNASKGSSPVFRSSWLGEYFAKSMLPREKLNTMKTFSNMNPMGSRLGREALDRFIEQQHTTLRLLHNAGSVNLNKVKTSISISKWIKLKLGDTFRVMIYHNQRHREQAQRVLDSLES